MSVHKKVERTFATVTVSTKPCYGPIMRKKSNLQSCEHLAFIWLNLNVNQRRN